MGNIKKDLKYKMTNTINFHIMETALVFCRVSPIVGFFPGSDYIPSIIKIAFSVLFSALCATVLRFDFLQSNYFAECMAEISIGVFIAITVHMVFMTIATAGGIINVLSGISPIGASDSSLNSGMPILGKFFVIIFVAFFFTSNMHLMLLSGVIKSYEIINYKSFFVDNLDFIEYISQIISKVFELSFKISLPIALISLLVYLSVGMVNKMIPYLQAFFIFIPVHLWISFFVLLLYINSMIMWFSDEFFAIISFLISNHN